jgi:aminotransferase in exopolysaccharide biosynthesis
MKEFVEFVRKLYNKPEGFIALHEPRFIGNEKKYLLECIDSTFVSSVGKFVDKFEEMTLDYTGAKGAVVVVNGTNALHLSLLLCGVKSSDEVITQPLTFIATANAISYSGASPIFIDVDKDTMGLSPSALKAFLDNETHRVNGETFNKKTGKRIKACVPMHTFGLPSRIDEIKDICDTYNIELVEDAAESLGSYYKGQHTGTFGKIGVLSYNGNKTITTGGGGMLLFNDEKLAKHAKHLTTQAKIPHPWEYRHDYVGYNYRMPNLNAALGVAQMENLSLFLENKRKIAQQYSAFFKNSAIHFQVEPDNSKANYWLNAIVLNSKEERDQFLEYTNKNQVMTRPIWVLMNELEMFKECQKDELINAKWLEQRVVNIPSSVIV